MRRSWVLQEDCTYFPHGVYRRLCHLGDSATCAIKIYFSSKDINITPIFSNTMGPGTLHLTTSTTSPNLFVGVIEGSKTLVQWSSYNALLSSTSLGDSSLTNIDFGFYRYFKVDYLLTIFYGDVVFEIPPLIDHAEKSKGFIF